MNLSLRSAAMIAWLLAGAFLTIKLVALWLNDGSDEGLAGVMFVAGFLSLVVAAVLSGVMIGRRRGGLLSAVGAVVMLILVVVMHSVIDGILKSIFTVSGWKQDEMGILADAVIALGIAGAMFMRRPAQVSSDA